MKFLAYAVAAWTIALGTSCRCARTQEGPKAVVTGTVVDAMQASITDAEVNLSGNGGKYQVETTSDGTYTVSVEPGMYEIRVRRPGFCDARRAMFILNSGARVELDFQLLACAIVDNMYNVTDGSPLPPPPVLHDRYQFQLLDPIKPSGLRPLVSFGDRREGGDLVLYSQLNLLDRYFPVVYTYDLLTIRADSLAYSRKDSSITATGNVVCQDGKGTRRGSRIRVIFDKGEPQINLKD